MHSMINIILENDVKRGKVLRDWEEGAITGGVARQRIRELDAKLESAHLANMAEARVIMMPFELTPDQILRPHLN